MWKMKETKQTQEIQEVWTHPETGKRTVTYADGTQSQEPAIENHKRKPATHEDGDLPEGKSESPK